MVILVILAYSIVGAYEINTLAKRKHWRDLTVFCFFIALSFILSLLYCLGVKLPNPVDALHNLLEWMGLHY